MIPSDVERKRVTLPVYQRGLVIDSQHGVELVVLRLSISKGIGD